MSGSVYHIACIVTMAMIQFLTIMLVVTCFLGGVISVTDKEFEVHTVLYTSVSPRINLYLYSGNYGEDTISNHIAVC